MASRDANMQAQEATGKYMRVSWPKGDVRTTHTVVTWSVRVTATNAGGSDVESKTAYISVTR